MGEHEKDRGKSKPVESVSDDWSTRQIRIVPEPIEERVVEPVVMTGAVQIEESGACANRDHVCHILVP